MSPRLMPEDPVSGKVTGTPPLSQLLRASPQPCPAVVFKRLAMTREQVELRQKEHDATTVAPEPLYPFGWDHSRTKNKN